MRVQAVAIFCASITIHAQCVIIGVKLVFIMKFIAREEYIIHISIYIIHIPKDK